MTRPVRHIIISRGRQNLNIKNSSLYKILKKVLIGNTTAAQLVKMCRTKENLKFNFLAAAVRH
jgi:hypothetical protein